VGDDQMHAAEQPAAADAFQRPLRSGFQARLSRSVRHPSKQGRRKSISSQPISEDMINKAIGEEFAYHEHRSLL
jgi:hypothetical protein